MSRSLPPFQLPLIFFVAEQDWQLSLLVITSRRHIFVLGYNDSIYHSIFQCSFQQLLLQSIDLTQLIQPRRLKFPTNFLQLFAFSIFQPLALISICCTIQFAEFSFFQLNFSDWVKIFLTWTSDCIFRFWEASDRSILGSFSDFLAAHQGLRQELHQNIWISYRFFLHPEGLCSLQCPDKFLQWKIRVTPWTVSLLLIDWEINPLRMSKMPSGTLFRASPPSSVSCSPRSKRIRFSRSRHRRAHPRRGIQGTRWNQFWWCSGNSLIELIFAFAMLSGYWSPIFELSPKGSTSRRTGSCGLQGVSAEQKSCCCS